LRHSGYLATLSILEPSITKDPAAITKREATLTVKPQISIVDIGAQQTTDQQVGERKNSILSDKSDLACKELDQKAYLTSSQNAKVYK
jgi:hypothetical protein